MMRPLLLAALLAVLPAAAVQAATLKVEVTRFHLLSPPAPPISGASITVEPATPAAESPATPPSLQFGALATSASAELARAGFKPMAAGQPADYVARLALKGTSEQVRKRSGFSLGLGGGTGGWNGGVGGSVAIPIGGGMKTVTNALLTMQIRRVADNSTVWEGRASTVVDGGDAMRAAPALLQALFKGFPGPSGQAVTLKVKTRP